LIGDRTSILLVGYTNMDFFFYRRRAGIFWVVELGSILAVAVLLLVIKQYHQKVEREDKTVVKDYFPTVLRCGTMVLLTLASFIPNKPKITNSIC